MPLHRRDGTLWSARPDKKHCLKLHGNENPMRSETQIVVDEIKQAVSLLRRHL